jgi:cell division protein FtsB
MTNEVLLFLLGALVPTLVYLLIQIINSVQARRAREFKALWKEAEEENQQLRQRVTALRARTEVDRFAEVD